MWQSSADLRNCMLWQVEVRIMADNEDEHLKTEENEDADEKIEVGVSHECNATRILLALAKRHYSPAAVVKIGLVQLERHALKLQRPAWKNAKIDNIKSNLDRLTDSILATKMSLTEKKEAIDKIGQVISKLKQDAKNKDTRLRGFKQRIRQNEIDKKPFWHMLEYEKQIAAAQKREQN